MIGRIYGREARKSRPKMKWLGEMVEKENLWTNGPILNTAK